MRLSKASAYAVFATVHIARNQDGGPVQGRSIAEQLGLPSEYLLKILQNLVRAQVLASETGRRGGFLLRRSPKEITLLDIVEGVEGPLGGELNLQRDLNGAEALRQRIEQVCMRSARSVAEILGGVTVEGLLETYR